MERSIDLNKELTTIARLALMAKIGQGFPLIDGLKVIESVETIVNSGLINMSTPMSAQVIETRDELTVALIHCAERSTDALRVAGHPAPGINSQSIVEDEWYALGKNNSADGDTIRALKVICSATSLMNAVAQPVNA